MAINQHFMQTLATGPDANTSGTTNPASPVKYGEAIFFGTDILPDLDLFIGQDRAKKQIRLAVGSAKARGKRMGHTLLAAGTPGAGKTTLAKLIAWEMGVGILECTGPISSDEAVQLISHLRDGDILCIDEAHTLGKKADWLLSLMTEGTMLTSHGAEQMPDITVICATTHASKLSEALLSRFEVCPRIEAYSDEEGSSIAEVFCMTMDVDLTLSQCDAFARAGNNNPRMIKKLVKIARDMDAIGDDIDLETVFEYAGVTEDGLDDCASDVLLALLGSKNHTASQGTIGAIIGEADNIAMIEKTLLSKGYLEVSRSGRSLTRQGVLRAKELLK